MTPSKPQIVGEPALVMHSTESKVSRATLSGRVSVITASNTGAYQLNTNPNTEYMRYIHHKRNYVGLCAFM